MSIVLDAVSSVIKAFLIVSLLSYCWDAGIWIGDWMVP